MQDVDSYIATADERARPVLEELRRIMKSTVPNVEESISWGVPFYRYHGALGGYAVYKNHVSFGAAGDLRREDREALEKDGYKTGKKTVQIGFDQKVPAAAIKRILKAQTKANEA
jgi:uncharacterized protein